MSKPLRLTSHSLEYKAIIESRKRIAEAAEKAYVVTVSHHHFNHHTPMRTGFSVDRLGYRNHLSASWNSFLPVKSPHNVPPKSTASIHIHRERRSRH